APRRVPSASLRLARGARLHARAAAWLERTGAAADEHASLLAHHYAEAAAPPVAAPAWKREAEPAPELPSRAVRWLRRAADLAVGRYEIDQALALLQEALALAPHVAARTDALRSLARAV